MSVPIDFALHVRVFRVGGTCFSAAQVEAMVERTNRKLAVAGIKIIVDDQHDVANASLAYVSQKLANGSKNLRQLLSNGSGPGKKLRIFLVKADLDAHDGSWTYDPIVIPGDETLWGGAIFIAELFNDNSDDRYVDMGYLASNDSLLHELGHVLMHEGCHYSGPLKNFFHQKANLTDDTIFPDQIARMRHSPYLQPAVT